MQLHVGQARLRGDFARYAARFDLLEVKAVSGRIPRAARLREWASVAPQGFQFSVVLGERVSGLDGSPAAAEELAFARKCAEALGARWYLVPTPPTVSPSQRSRAKLRELFAALANEGRRIAWEPRGAWEPEVAAAFAAELDVVLVQDLSQEVAAGVAAARYVRLRGVGAGARVTAGALERVAERVEGAEQVLVVLEGEGAARAVAELRGLLEAGVPIAPDDADDASAGGSEGGAAAAEDDDLDDDEEDDDWDDDDEEDDDD
jgi:uncharacterized protein YecE (DUF72 family)